MHAHVNTVSSCSQNFLIFHTTFEMFTDSIFFCFKVFNSIDNPVIVGFFDLYDDVSITLTFSILYFTQLSLSTATSTI